MRVVARWPWASLRVASLLDRAYDLRGSSRGLFNFRDRVVQLTQMQSQAPESFPRVASAPDPSALRPPLVLATFHMGALWSMEDFLERLPGDVLVLSEVVRSRPGGITAVGLGKDRDEWRRVAAMKHAVDTLGAGGFVMLAVDGAGSSRRNVKLFGKNVWLANGGFALARLTGTPMLPITARWRGSRIEIIVGDPVPPGDEAVMAARLASWLEQYLRETPGGLRWPIVQRLKD